VPFQTQVNIGRTWQCTKILAAITVALLTSVAFQTKSYGSVWSHRSPGIFQQIRLGFWSGLTYRLYVLSSRIGVIKLEVEVRPETIHFPDPLTDKNVLADGRRTRTYFVFHRTERYCYSATYSRS
jgi:hypothetical protein